MNPQPVFRFLLKDARKVFHNPRATPDCPAAEAIVDYVYGDLPAAVRADVARHIDRCESCKVLSLQIETDRTELELKIDRSPETFFEGVARPLPKTGAKERTSKTKRSFGSLSRIKEALITWVSPIWEPQFAGQVVTAADVVEQAKRFEMDYGEYVNISCSWKGKAAAQEAHLNLTWKANFIEPRHIRVRFVDPESNETLSEMYLGSNLEGYRQVSDQELGFDPTERRWAISILTEET